MAANTSPIFVKNITGKGTAWTNSDAASTKKVITPTIGAEGTRVHFVSATSSDTVNRDFNLYLNDGTTDFLVGCVTVPAGSGSSGSSATLNLSQQTLQLTFLASDGSILVPTGWSIKAENATQVTAAKQVTFMAIAGDY